MPVIVLRASLVLIVLALGSTAAAAPGWAGGRLLFTQKGEPVPLADLTRRRAPSQDTSTRQKGNPKCR